MVINLLEKDPQKRATLEQIANCDWITMDGKEEIDFLVNGRPNRHTQLNESEYVDFGNMSRIMPKIQTLRGNIEEIDDDDF